MFFVVFGLECLACKLIFKPHFVNLSLRVSCPHNRVCLIEMKCSPITKILDIL